MEKIDNLIIRGLYEKLERLVLILIAIPLPFFAIVYLDSQNGMLFTNVPKAPSFIESAGFTTILVLLGLNYINFHKEVRKIKAMNGDLLQKIQLYVKATTMRFWTLMISALICAVGLLLFQNPLYTLLFAVTLVFFSLGKPTPDRIVRLLQLKGEEREAIRDLKRRV
jgi:ribosomal protein L30/L7E